MTYTQTVARIRALANAVNPSGTFVNSKTWDFGLISSKITNYPAIVLFPPTIDTGSRGITTTATCIVGFFDQDRSNESPNDVSVQDQEEALIGTMFDLSRAFFRATLTDDLIDILDPGFKTEPAYKLYQNVLTGVTSHFVMQGTDGNC